MTDNSLQSKILVFSRTQILLRILQGINMIRGVFIFLIFIWKPTIWKAIKETHPRLAKCLHRRQSDLNPESPETRATIGGPTEGLMEVKKAKQRLTTTEIEDEIEIQINGDCVKGDNAKSRQSVSLEHEFNLF